MKKIAVLYILLLTSCWCLFTLTRDIGEESVISYVQTHHDPWKTLSYSMPVEMSVFADIDSIPWEIKDQPTLNWFYENFNNLETLCGGKRCRQNTSTFRSKCAPKQE